MPTKYSVALSFVDVIYRKESKRLIFFFIAAFFHDFLYTKVIIMQSQVKKMIHAIRKTPTCKVQKNKSQKELNVNNSKAPYIMIKSDAVFLQLNFDSILCIAMSSQY